MKCPRCGSTDVEPDFMFKSLTRCKSCELVADTERFQTSEKTEEVDDN